MTADAPAERAAAGGAASRRTSAFPRPIEVLIYGVAPLATLVTAPILARGLGPIGRGELGVALSATQFALTLSAWGQAETYLVEARHGRFGYRQQTQISLVGGVVTAVLVVALLVALGIPLPLAVVSAAWVPLLNQANLWRSVSVAVGSLRAPALQNAVGPILRAVLLVALAALGLITAEGAAAVTQGSLLIGAVLTVGLTARRLGHGPGEIVPLLRLLRQGGAVIAFDVFNALALRSDLLVLQIFASPHEVGLYAAPASLTGSAIALSIPFKSRMQAAVVAGRPRHVVAREAVPVFLLVSAGATALWFLAPFLVDVFFGSAYADSVPLLRLLGIATVPLLMVDLAQGVLVVLAERRALIGVGAVDAAVVVLSLAVLCPLAGPAGAATACIIGYAVAAVVAGMVAWRGLERHLPA